MILALNTAQSVGEIALLSDPNEAGQVEKIIAERTWPIQRDEEKRLITYLEELLEETGLDKKEITKIIVVRGPGSFTTLRTGVATANALAEGLKADLFCMDTFTLLIKSLGTTDPVLAVLFAGGMEVAVSSSEQISKTPESIGPLATTLAPFEHDRYQVVYELPETLADELRSIAHEKNWEIAYSNKRCSLAETVLTYGLDIAEPVQQVDVYYLKNPSITVSSNKWKQ